MTLVLYSAMCATLKVEDLRKENQHLKRTMSKVNNIAITTGDTGDECNEPTFEAHHQYPENPTVGLPLINCTSKIHSPPLSETPQPESVELSPPTEISQSESVEVPMESNEIQEDETNDNRPIHTCHNIPEHILAIIESKESETHDSGVLDLQKLENISNLDVIQLPSIINTCMVDEYFPPVHESQSIEECNVTEPFQKLQFIENTTVTNTV